MTIDLYLTYGLQRIGSNEINAYSVWAHWPGRGQRSLSGLKMSRAAADEAMELWAGYIVKKNNAERLSHMQWFDVWCGKGQVVL